VNGSTEQTARLNGWKEIASYLGKGVRTVQRWESQFGLPVRRIAGEVVFALRDEVDAWSTSQSAMLTTSASAGSRGPDDEGPLPESQPLADRSEEAAPVDRRAEAVAGPAAVGDVGPAPIRDHEPGARRRPPRGAMAGAGATALILLVAVWAWFAYSHSAGSSAGPLDAWAVDHDQLCVFDAAGRQLWCYSLPSAEEQASSSDPREYDDSRRAAIEDLDGDGTREFLFIARGADDARHGQLLVFEADGTRRFAYQHTKPVRFGDRDYRGPFQPRWLKVTRDGHESASIWLQSQDRVFFPGMLERLDNRGRVVAEYWNGGVVSGLSVTGAAENRLVLIGATVNDSHGASLALFHGSDPAGSAPAFDRDHSCVSCGAGGPLRMLVFPRNDLCLVHGGQSSIRNIVRRDDDTIIVSVEHATETLPGNVRETLGNAIYTVDLELNVVGAEHYSGYRLLHDFFWKAGRFDHPYGERDEAELLPVLRWDGASFRAVMPSR
jgi:hypothetical protein